MGDSLGLEESIGGCIQVLTASVCAYCLKLVATASLQHLEHFLHCLSHT